MRTTLIAALLLASLATVALAAPPAGPGRTHAVTIRDMQFSPASIQVTAGDAVVWTNADDRDHTVVAADGSFASPNLSAGATFKQTFDKPGTVAYGCTYHPRMKGTVEVTK